jgi:TatD DNase family protein
VEALEQADVGAVAGRIPAGVCTEIQIEADGRAGKRQLLDGHAPPLVPLDSTERRVVEPDRSGSFAQAQPGGGSRLPDIGADRRCLVPGTAVRPITWSLAGRHERSLSRGAYLRLTPYRYDPPVRLIDSHCHLNADRFADDVDAVVARAQAAGVERILVPGWNPASCERALELAARIPWLDVSVGVHPHDASKVDGTAWARIVELSRHERVVAIGETGLDYDRRFSPIPEQLANLRRNLRLALETGKPAILHVRSPAGRSEAQEAMLAELRAAGIGSANGMATFGDRVPAVIHSFSGSVEYARQILDLGLAISISGLAFRSGEGSTADVVPLVQADRLLVETDSPFLSPPGAPRGRNEPAHVWVTAEWVAARRAAAPTSLGAALVAAYDRTFRR